MKPLLTAVVCFIFGASVGAYFVGNLVHRRQSAVVAFDYLAISQRLRANKVDDALAIADGNLLQLLTVNHSTAASAWRYFIPSSTGITDHTIRNLTVYPPIRLSEVPPFMSSYPEMEASNVSEIKKWYKDRLDNEHAALEILAQEQNK